MNRRNILQLSCLFVSPAVAGCGGDGILDGPPSRRLRIRLQRLTQTDREYQLNLTISNDLVRQGDIDNVTIIAYSESGEIACEKAIGTLGSGNREENVNISCSGFPALISAEISNDCNNVIIDILHWIGTDSQKSLNIPDEIPNNTPVYNGTETRNCGEPLPPEWFTGTNGSTKLE